MNRISNGFIVFVIGCIVLCFAQLVGLLLAVPLGHPEIGLFAAMVLGIAAFFALGAFVGLCYLVGWFLEYTGWAE